MMEYLGIRFAMLDAIQRYHADPANAEKSNQDRVAAVQQHIQDAASENKLLGSNGALIGEAWSRLIGSRNAQAVVDFVENPAIKGMTDSLPSLKDRAATMGTMEAVGYVAQNAAALKPMVVGFENLASDTGLINYRCGESLSGHIETFSNQIRAEQKLAAVPIAPVSDADQKTIEQVFQSDNGPVDPKYLGKPKQDWRLPIVLAAAVFGLQGDAPAYPKVPQDIGTVPPTVQINTDWQKDSANKPGPNMRKTP